MKLKKIMAVASCAALIAATAVPLAACGGGRSNGKPLSKGELNLADYAVDYADSSLAGGTSYSRAAVGFTELGKGMDSVGPLGSSNDAVMWFAEKENATTGETAYSVFNIKTGRTVLSNVKVSPGYQSIAGGIQLASVRTPAASGTPESFAFYGEDGTKLIEGVTSYINGSSVDCYINGKATKALMVYGYASDDNDTVEKYFEVKTDDAGNRTYAAVAMTDIKLSDSEISVGDSVFGVSTPVYPKDEDKPVVGDIANYSYAVNGSDIVFYNGTTETGRVAVDKAQGRAFVGDYMYYTELTALPENGDANLIINDDGSYVKYDYAQYRYNILTNKKEKLDHNIFVTRVRPVYNYATKAYDAAIVDCYAREELVMQAFDYTYMVTADFALAYDLSQISFGSGNFELIKADAGKYVIRNSYNGYTVVNDSFEMLSRAEQATYYAEEKLFAFSEGQAYGFAGLDGKAVAAPVYSAISGGMPVFYGGKALVGDVTTQKVVALSADGTTRALPEESSSDTKEVDVDYENGWYYVTTTTFATQTEPEKTVVELFDLGGTSLKKIENARNVSVNGSIVIVYNDDNTRDLYLVK